ncbi:MAG: type II toxin-antitoxin system prevent-host-death family antitoxin [Bacteroidetes bacterium]|jgi:prevent-host-death family protein|nr:type II toxin-antitoxin system prevent-host-death family antitoxin [Bacteroidota bacterium]
MYPTKGVDTVATISELRAKTSEVLAHVRDQKEAVLIQRNNDPFAVLLDWQTYEQLMAHRTDDEADVDSNE